MERNEERRRLTPDDLAAMGGRVLPRLALKTLLRTSLAGLGACLCLHRVAPAPRPTDWQPGLAMPPAELDALLELLLSFRPGGASGWLTLSFDDGYLDAAEYIRTRATRFPAVEFMFFVCPEKLERRAGFRWDLAERAMNAGTSREAALALLDAPPDADENGRADLRALADAPEFKLATVEAVRELASLPNVAIGNHTNLHLSAAKLGEAQVEADYRASTAKFAALFGPQKHFAFPYGTPRHHFSAKNVAMLRALGDFTIWTTEARPFKPSERRPGAVLPRFPVNGQRSAKELAGWIAARSLDFRVRGPRQLY